RHLMTAQEVELPVRVEAALAPVDALERPEAPRPEERRDACGPCPLPHSVEALAVPDLVAVDELLVSEDVPVRVDDPLGETRRARGEVELRRVVRGRGRGDVIRRRAGQ